ncbi:MAG: formate dehydrogenase accessory sulfurtransferase FdhD [Thermoplasmata archaeon]
MKKIRIKRWRDGDLAELEDLVAEETFLHLEINEKIGFDTIVSPENIREFVYGNLFSEGFIDAPSDIKNYLEREKDGDLHIDVTLDLDSELAYRRNYNILWTDCTTPSDIQKRIGDRIAKIDSPLKVRAEDIPLVQDRISDRVDVYRQTGAYHYAFLFDEGIDLVSSAFDVSRHNAVDKVIGGIFLDSGTFADKALFVTGRITSNMIWKCLRAGIPLAMSRSAPLLEAIKLARTYDMGVIGFARGKRFNLYCGDGYIDFG